LRLNADAADGEVRVQVFEVEEDSQHVGRRAWKQLDKFSTEKCRPLRGELFGGVVQWDGASWSDLQGKRVGLRIHLNSATLFSFWTRTEPNRTAIVNLVE
jgi:hypothetical protein